MNTENTELKRNNKIPIVCKPLNETTTLSNLKVKKTISIYPLNASDVTVITASHDKSYLCDYMASSLKNALGWLPPIVVMNNGSEIHRPKFDFEQWVEVDNRGYKLNKLPEHLKESQSARHCASLSWAINHLVVSKWIILADNDVLFLPSVKEVVSSLSEKYDAVGQVGHSIINIERLFPYFCIINHEKMVDDAIEYFDPLRLNIWGKGEKYDTGSSFLEDILSHGWKIKHIKLENCILHLKGTTTTNKNPSNWLMANKELHGLEVR